MNALLIYSGGMDSTTLLYEFQKDIKLAISFNYGGRHNDREFEVARQNTARLGIPHKRLDIRPVMELFKSSLLQGQSPVPDGYYNEENMRQTVVPFRNGIMLSIAGGIAASNGLDTIMIGNHAGDHTIYPDCRAPFIDAMNAAFKAGLWENVQVVSPYQNIDKRGIALRGKSLGVDYRLSYTCYKGGEKHCGTCGACTERKEALAGFDPTEYLA